MALSTDQYGYLIDPLVPITDDNGTTIKDGFLRVYIAGSSTPVITYRNFDESVNEKTIELDNSGRCKYPVIVNKSLAYKVVVYDAQHSQETPIITVDKLFSIGASITAGAGATVVTGIDSLTTKPDGFVDASVIGTDGYVALDHTLVEDDLDTDAKVTAVENDRYVPLLNDDVNDPDSKMTLGRLWKWVLGNIKSLSTTITAFRSGDVIPVDGPSGTAKMPKAALMEGVLFNDTISATKRVILTYAEGEMYSFTNESGSDVYVTLRDGSDNIVVNFGALEAGHTITYIVQDVAFSSVLLYPTGTCSVVVKRLTACYPVGERLNRGEFLQNLEFFSANLTPGSYLYKVPYIPGTSLKFTNSGAGEFDVYLMKSRSTSPSERATEVITHLSAGKSVVYDVVSNIVFNHIYIYVRSSSTVKVEQLASNVGLSTSFKNLSKENYYRVDSRVFGLDVFQPQVESGFYYNVGAVGTTFDYSTSRKKEDGWESIYTNDIYWNSEITLKGYGNNSVNVYAWLDADNKILEVGTQAGFQGTLKAPTGAKKFVYNNRKSASLGFIYKGVFNVEKDPFTIAHFNGSPFENFFAVANGVLNSQFRTDKILLSDPMTEKACHVSSFVQVGTKYYYAYYCNYITATENVSQQTARFGYCNTDGTGKSIIDVMSVGDTYGGENVVALSDAVVLSKPNDTNLIVCWTIAIGADWASRKWRLVYAIYDTLTNTLSTPSDCGISYNGSASVSFTCENVTGLGVGSCPNGTVQIMPKITSRVENGVDVYYTGLGIETYCAIIKSTNLHDWEIVSRPIGMNCEYEPACYILNDSPNILHWFCRQSASEGSAVYAQYDIANNVWKNKLYFQDTQSRPDMFEFDGGLYVIHAVPNRNHIVIEKIDVLHPWESTIHSDIYSEQSFYPFALVESDHIEISFTQDRKYIYLSNFSMYAISRESLNTKLLELLS